MSSVPPTHKAGKRCGGRLPGTRCKLNSGHHGRHTSWPWSWNNPRDPDCFWCGQKAVKRVRVSGSGPTFVCADFVRLSEQHWPDGVPSGMEGEDRVLGIYGQGCREAVAT